MESLTSPSHSLPSHPSLTHFSPLTTRTSQLLFLTKPPKHRHHNPLFLAATPTQALNNTALVAASTSPAAHVGGDLSVLIPISVLLLAMYWVANFIVPGMISEDLQQAASAQEPEQEAASSGEVEKVSMDVKPDLEVKKERKIKKSATSR
ncbi:hypothetical protein Cni_G21779 [Canna indica]|uniref:Uncharacterized protein n=1 Tax=Canna indica TaxID=4628 RepID=A0AAQ3KRH6_9LILI|nr:hypothetical protein Cni_G21779 [Canna indica]